MNTSLLPMFPVSPATVWKLIGCGLFAASQMIACVWAGEINLGSSVARTPYDPYLEPLWKVFGGLGSGPADRSVVERLVREGRQFRYSYKKEQPYVPQVPEVTDVTKSGDCKAKSLWLASKMNTRNLRYVIGKFQMGDAQSHAWLLWESAEGWLVLDATNFSRPVAPERMSSSQLVPLYSYGPDGKYAHPANAAGKADKYGDHL